MSQYAYDPYMPARQTNGLGLAGFICSLLGLLTGGILSPVGLILSIAAIGKQPRGFAIAGLVLGLIGTCGGILVLVLFGGLLLAALGIAAVAVAYSQPEKIEITTDMASIAKAVQDYRDENHFLPADLGLLHIDESRLIDPWGQRYSFEKIDPTEKFDIISSGEDKKIGTLDDVRLSKLDKMWSKSGLVHISSDSSGKGGTVQIDLGGQKVDVAGDDEGGSVKINLGDKVIEIKGDDEGGKIDVGTQPQSQPAEDVPITNDDGDASR